MLKLHLCSFLHEVFCSPGKLQLIVLLIATFPQASWPSSNAFVSGSGGQRFKSRAGKIGHGVANSLPHLRHFFQKSSVARAQ